MAHVHTDTAMRETQLAIGMSLTLLGTLMVLALATRLDGIGGRGRSFDTLKALLEKLPVFGEDEFDPHVALCVFIYIESNRNRDGKHGTKLPHLR